MFIEALFTTAKLWKQLRCPTADEWVKKMWYVYTMEYFSVIKEDKIFFCRKIDVIGYHHVKQNKIGSERQRSHVVSLSLSLT
jgi:hypothetical protein